MTQVTGAMIQEIRRRKADGQPLKVIARALRIHRMTVWKYSSDENLATVKRTERRTKERIKADPERMAKRRRDAQEYTQRVRAELRAIRSGMAE